MATLPRIFAHILVLVGAVIGLTAADLTSQYEFLPVQVGGGGWVNGVTVHRTTPGVVYCHTDVGGAYRWNPTTNRWTQLITANRMPASVMSAQGNENEGFGVTRASAYNVEAMALDPANAQTVYLAAGNGSASGSPPGFLLKSTDGGASFAHLTGAAIRIAGNGEGRGAARFQVDPKNSQVVYYASRSDGVQRSLNGGTTWSRLTVPAGLIVEAHAFGVSGIACDAGSATVAGRTSRVYAAAAKQGIYTSTDGGENWSKISGGTGKPADTGVAARVVVEGGTLYVAYGYFDGAGPGIWRYTPAAGWTNITPQANVPYDLAVDPLSSQRLFAVNSWGMKSAWRSTTGGSTWTALGTHSSDAAGRSHFSSAIAPWKTLPPADTPAWRSIGQFAFDPHHAGRLWFAEGFGMWRCDNFSDSNNTPDFVDVSHGIEEMVCNQVLDLPGTKTLIATWDRPGFISTASTTYAGNSPFWGGFSDMSSAATSGGNPSFVVATASDHNYFRYAPSATSSDGGTTWTQMASTPAAGDPTPGDLKFGEVTVSATNTNLLVWYPRNTDTKLYVSTNRGASWTTATAPGLTGFVPFFAASTRVLISDRVNQRFGFYNWDSGNVSISTTGTTWSATTGTGLPTYCYRPIHVATPGNANDWWFATGYDYRADSSVRGLYRSTNGGLTYSKNPGWDDTWCVGFGKAAAGTTYPTIFAFGKRGEQSGLFRSTDGGATWDRCVEHPLGIFDLVTSITGDMDTFGRVHVGFNGNTAAEGRLKSAPTNQAPSVNAGLDRAVTLPAAASLDATVSDDGLPSGSSVAVTWSKLSGPGQVTFANVAAVDMTAIFTSTGTYVLRLTASDTTLSAHDDVTVTVTANTSGPDLTGQDIGSTALAGSTVDGGSTITVAGSGHDIWGRADAFHFASMSVAGDFDYVTRVDSQTNTDVWAKAGIMLRASLTPGAIHASVFVTPARGVVFQYRSTTNGASGSISGSQSAAPVWLKLIRRGTTVTTFDSVDGQTWRRIGSRTLSIPSNAFVGLAVTSHDHSERSTAVFSNVQTTPSASN